MTAAARPAITGSPFESTASKLEPNTAARRGFALSPVIHGRSASSKYTLDVRFETWSAGCSAAICGGNTFAHSASAALAMPAAIALRSV